MCAQATLKLRAQNHNMSLFWGLFFYGFGIPVRKIRSICRWGPPNTGASVFHCQIGNIGKKNAPRKSSAQYCPVSGLGEAKLNFYSGGCLPGRALQGISIGSSQGGQGGWAWPKVPDTPQGTSAPKMPESFRRLIAGKFLLTTRHYPPPGDRAL